MEANLVNSVKSKNNSSLAQESCISDSIIEAPSEARFECPICLTWLRDPVVTSCGHRFCRNCIQSWLERENPCCPVDNMKLQKDTDIFPDNFTKREISQQRSKCPNIVRGCLEELSPFDIETHLLTCPFRLPELPENEKLRCAFVDVGCEEKFEDEPELQRHLEQKIQAHLSLLSRAYTKLMVNNEASAGVSAIAEQANFWDPPSKSEQAVVESATTEGIQNLLKALYEKIVVLEQKNREQDIIIANMSNQLSAINLEMSKLPLRYCNGQYVWYVTDIRNKIKNMKSNSREMHYSPGFYTSPNGYRLCIRLNLSPYDANYIAVLIHMMKSDLDHTLEWPFSGRLTITLIHPRDSQMNIKETMMTRPELEAFKRPDRDLNLPGFGYTEFALIDKLFSQGFIENNQLIIKVQAQPV